MIVKMKKASIIVLDKWKKQTLRELREFGLVHLEQQRMESIELIRLREKRMLLERTLLLVQEVKKKSKDKEKEKYDYQLDKAIQAAEIIAGHAEEEHSLKEKAEQLKKEIARISLWGNFEPEEIKSLEESGVVLRLYRLQNRELEKFPEGIDKFTIVHTKSYSLIACVVPGENKDLLKDVPGEEFQFPAQSLSRLQEELKKNLNDQKEAGIKWQKLVEYKSILKAGIAELDSLIEFENARAGMAVDENLAYLTGYLPAERVGDLEKVAKEKGWGLLVEEPGEQDPVPTLVKNPKAVRIIKPVFELLGVTPGYREFDISFWFLLFFSIFFAMIIGDAGYGVLFFVFTVFLSVKLKNIPPEPIFLLFVTSICTIIWGTVTGTWFGSKELAELWPFSIFVINAISSFPKENIDTTQIIMQVCFVLGLVQLSIAHIMSFFKNLPKFKAWAELGWLFIVWAAFLLVQILVLGSDWLSTIVPGYPQFTYVNIILLLLITGGALIAICSEQNGNFIKGLLIGIGKLPIKALDAISCFSDIISYVRLFAVGLATVKVAEAFNLMAQGVGFGFPLFIGAALILFFGHFLNIIMSAMSIAVHGIRLNMLEFSGHLGMEWIGIPYSPFNNKKTNSL
jgi:V/A-type H+-transporting ATPase subunit I